jgi:hypothetical protein
VGCDEVAVVRPVDRVGSLEDWKHVRLASANNKGGHMVGTPNPTVPSPDIAPRSSRLPSFQSSTLPQKQGDSHE